MAISQQHVPNIPGNRIAASLNNLAISQQQNTMRGPLVHRNTGYNGPRAFNDLRAFNGYPIDTPGSTYTTVTEEETPQQYIIPHALLNRLVTQHFQALRNSLRVRETSSVQKTAITRVRFFNGRSLEGPTTVVIDGDVIGRDPTGATTFIDGTGKVLLPGLIDCHLHIMQTTEMKACRDAGITTCMGMEEFPPVALAGFREAARAPGMCDLKSAGLACHFDPKGMPPPGLVTDPIQAAKWVDDQAQAGSDYIKIIIDKPDIDPKTLKALVDAAHAQGLQTVSHCVWQAAYEDAMAAGVDMITHTPVSEVLDAKIATELQKKKIPVSPTLIMMKTVSGGGDAFRTYSKDYENAKANVAVMNKAHVDILAGTDSNHIPGTPAHVDHGGSLHTELELLVEAGLTPIEALRAATVLPAQKFQCISDRGVIAPGKRADLVLVDGDPTKDISKTREIRYVWCEGVVTPF
ncbi:hypothetical protein MMC30_008835 [Trapelia coarctata]|nr:hypothetical protein [Trapelia coarctata]